MCDAALLDLTELLLGDLVETTFSVEGRAA